MKNLLLITSVLLLCGCANSDIGSNIRSSTRYAIAAEAAGQKNDWHTARMDWANAVACAEQENRTPITLAEMYFEYGRSLAVVGEFPDAGKYLSKALEIDEKTHGNSEVDLSELARINLDQKKFKEALAYYDELLRHLMKINVDSARPESFMVILSEYSTCLNAAGRNQDASAVNALMKRLQAENQYPSALPKRIPYGRQTVSFPIPTHKFETVQPEPAAPVDLNVYLAKKTQPRNPFFDEVATQILVYIIAHPR